MTMRPAILLRTSVLLFGILTSALPLSAQTRSAAFLDLLSRVPDALLDSTPYPYVLYVDLAAVQAVQAGQAGPLKPLDLLQGMELPLFAAQVPMGLEGAWQAQVGFGPLDLGPTLGVDAAPRGVWLTQLPAGVAAQVGPALLASGYVAGTMGGVETYARGGEDFAVDLMARDPADPFGQGMGKASRVALDGALLMQSAGWPDLRAMATAGKPPIRPDLAALASVLDDPAYGAAHLLQAHLLPDARAIAAPGAGRLPPWHLGLVADLSDGQNRSTLVAIVYPSRAEAETAAAQIKADWASLPLTTAAMTMAEMTGHAGVLRVVGDGPAVAVLELTGPASDTQTYRRLLTAEMRRDLAIFAAP